MDCALDDDGEGEAAHGAPGEDTDPEDFFGPAPGLRWLLTGVGGATAAGGFADAHLSGPSASAGLAVALGAGLVWTVWRARLPTWLRVAWLAWLVGLGAAVAWAGRPELLLPGLAGLGAGLLAPSIGAARRPAGGDREAREPP